jgi:hypothetical protein
MNGHTTTSDNTKTCANCGRDMSMDTQTFYINGVMICGICYFKITQEKTKTMKAKKIMKLFYWYYCNSTSCEGIDQKKLLQVDKLMEEYENNE